ncbi:MAG: hypothetical protein WCS80_01320 [Bacilli bacterium]
MLKKRIGFALLGVLIVLTGCGEKSSSSVSDKPASSVSSSVTSSSKEEASSSSVEKPEYERFEAEYINVTDPILMGSGISGSAAGVNLVLQDANSSNGWFIGYSHRTGFAVTYKITADKAATAKMKLGFGNELGVGMTMNTASLAFSLNGTAVTYNQFVIQVDGWHSYDFSSTLNLVKGENTLVMTVGTNEYCNGGPGGPLFDYIYLKTEAALSWNPVTSNIEE